MLSNMLANARAQARHSAQSAGIGVFASLALIVGLAFWTGAIWLFLLTLTSPLNACVILGAAYTGAGLIGFATITMRRAKPVQQTSTKPPQATMDGLVSAFMTGLTAGARTRS